MHPCTGRLTDLCWKPRWSWHTWAGASLKKSCTALKVHLYWPISTQISKNRNFRDSQQIAWLKKKLPSRETVQCKKQSCKSPRFSFDLACQGPWHIYSCVFFFTTLQGRTKRKSKTQRPDRSLGGGFKDSLFYPLQERALVHPCNFRLVINLQPQFATKNGICSGILRKRLTNLSGKAARTQLRWKKGELEIGGWFSERASWSVDHFGCKLGDFFCLGPFPMKPCFWSRFQPARKVIDTRKMLRK